MSKIYAICFLCSFSMAIGACEKPIPQGFDISGCYYGNGPSEILEIEGNKLKRRNGDLATNIIRFSAHGDHTIIEFDSPVSLIDDGRKILTLMPGDEKFAIAFMRSGKPHILFSGVVPIELVRDNCRGDATG